MLQIMRTGAKSMVVKIFLFGLLACAMLGLAVIGDSSLFHSSGSHRSYVAEMDGGRIAVQEFDRAVQNEVRARGMTTEQAYLQGVPQRLLQAMVNERVMALATRDLGIQVDDTTAALEVKKILADAVKSGMSEKDALNSLLAQTGLSEKQLVNSIKSDIATNMVIHAIANNASVPQMLVDDAVKLRHEVREGVYFTITADEIGKVEPATDADLMKIYNDSKSQYMRPEYRSFAVVTLDKKALGISGTVTDEDVRAYYDQHAGEFKMPATRDVDQVVVKDEDEAKKIVAAAKATSLKQAVTDSASKAKIISNSYEKAALPGELADKVFDAKDGDVVGPLKTPLGWHVMLIGKNNAAGVQAFDKVSANIRKKLIADNGASALYDKANAIDDMISSGKSLADISAQYNLKEKDFSKVDAGGMTANGNKAVTDIPVADKILSSAFGLEQGETSQLIELPGNAGFAIVETREIMASEAEPFEKVRADILKVRNLSEERRLLDKKSAELTEKLGMGETFDKLAGDLKKKVERAAPVSRMQSTTKPGLTRDVETALFSLQKNGEAKVFPADGKILVVKLNSRKVDEAKAHADGDKKAISEMLQRNAQGSLLDQFAASMFKKYDVEVYPEVVSELYAPKAN